MPAAEIEAFDRVLDEKLAAAHAWELWGAAYLINGGCSDDGFYYFRAWLVGRGRAVYEAAVARPDSLAAVVSADAGADGIDHECEPLLAVAAEAYEAVTGREIPRGPSMQPAEPRGRRWDFDDDAETRKRLPRLAEMFC